jgi:hypothetical protein
MSKKDIEAFYKKMAACSEREDLGGLKALVSDSATFSLLQRPNLGKASWAATLARTFAAMDRFSVRYQLGDVRVRGGAAQVRLSQVTRAVYKDPQGKPHTMEALRELEDTLVRTGNRGWLLQSSRVTRLVQKIDGKLVR